jgi:hypothetical protein
VANKLCYWGWSRTINPSDELPVNWTDKKSLSYFLNEGNIGFAVWITLNKNDSAILAYQDSH